MEVDFGIEFEAETVVTSIGQEVTGSETAEDKSLSGNVTSPFSLENYYRMKGESGRMSEAEIQELILKPRMHQINSYTFEYNRDPRRDCRTAHSHRGLLSVPALIRDAITGNGCKWRPVLKMGEQPSYIISSQTADTFKTLLPVKVNNNKIIFNITKEGEIRIKGVKISLNAIQGIMEAFKNEYPDGSVVITCDRDSPYQIALEMLEQAREARVKLTIIRAER